MLNCRIKKHIHIFYQKVVGRNVETSKTEANKKLKIIVVIAYNKRFDEFRLALETFECYCIQQGYSFVAYDSAKNKSFDKVCRHKNVSVVYR